MSSPRQRTAWWLLLAAGLLRLVTQGWDSGLLSPHPDERQVAFVTERLGGWFADPGFYAYGSLHFQLVRAASVVLGEAGRYAGLLVGGRLLSLLCSLAALAMGWWIARRGWGERTARWFLLLAMWVPLDLQQSHFATVEAHHAAWTLAALAAAVAVATRGSDLAALAAGAAAGASLAVKVASLPLALPLAVAAVLAARGRGGWTAVRLAAVMATSGIAAFWLAQPWAFAGGRPPLVALGPLAVGALALWASARPTASRPTALALAGAMATLVGLAALALLRLNPLYLAGVGEQIAMVLGQTDLPYVRVYRATLPVLYPARELALWGLGPALALAALAGVAAALLRLGSRWRRLLGRRFNRADATLVVVLSWLLPMAVRLATLEVKYLRYWTPLVVPIALVASWALVRLPARGRRFVAPAAAATTALAGLAFLWAFITPHPHRTAAEWLALVVEPQQTVAFEHWDETVALPRVEGVRTVELPSYEVPDDAAKVRAWTATLAEADWVVLTSHRVRRTVLANPGRYPHTARLYQLLLAGEAGFKPLTTVSRAPRLLGLELDVQRADESFVNYDFPRVVILRRVAAVDPEELARRAERPLPGLEGLSGDAFEARLVDPLPDLPPVPDGWRQAADSVAWVLALALGASAVWALALPVLRSWPDAGVGLALVTGWLGPAWLLWLGSELGWWQVGTQTAAALLGLLLAAGAAAAWHRRALVARLLRQRGRGMLAVALVTASVWLLFLGMRAVNPAVHWGEKPMDLSFLGAFVRADAWPPGEPWLAGMPLYYYYFGEVLASWPILLTGTPVALGYNLMAASVPALAAAPLAALALAAGLRRRRRAAAWLLPLLVLLTGNLAWPFLLDLARAGRWFDLWWATSRVVPGFAIDEYPLWTSTFADLHAHFLALPVAVAAMLWGFRTTTAGREWPLAAGLAGVAAGVLAATNPWDLLVLTAALATVALAGGRPVRSLVRLAAAGAVSLAAAAPFLFELAAGFARGVGGRGIFLTGEDYAPWWAVVRHFGVFLVPLAILAFATLGRATATATVLALAGIGAGWYLGSSAAGLALALSGVFVARGAAEGEPGRRFAWALAALAGALVAVAEWFTFIDRMNTLFKIYNGVWLLLAVALAVLLLREQGSRRRLLAAVWLPLQLLGLVNLPLGIAQGVLQPRAASPRPTLDGQAFLRERDPDTWFLVRTLSGASAPGEVVAEAAGPSYQDFTRIAMHTGQPTVVGWEYHLQQRGQRMAEIEARRRDLERLYTDPDPAVRRAVVDRYDVRWVVVAPLERAAYAIQSAEPLAGTPGLAPVARRGQSAVWAVLHEPAATAVAPVASAALPEGAVRMGRVPVTVPQPLRSLTVDAEGGAVVLLDGSVLRLGRDGRPLAPPSPPACSTLSAVAWRGATWALCAGGALIRGDGGGWREVGRIEGATGLSSGSRLWAWGPRGAFASDDGLGWARVVEGSIRAFALRGEEMAWSDGRVVRARSARGERVVGGRRSDVTGLAWDRRGLWALSTAGLERSGGGLLPWRPALDELGPVAAVAGDVDRLWLVRGDGDLIEWSGSSCAPPWSQDSGLAEPRGVVVAPEGWLVVADTRNHRLCWYDMSGQCLDQLGVEGTGPGQFREPSGLAVRADGTLAVADTWNGRIQLIGPDGSITVVGRDLYGPRGVAWADDGSLWVADTGNRRLLRFEPRSWSRAAVLDLGAPVVGVVVVGERLAVAVPSRGEVVLVDPRGPTAEHTLPVPGWVDGGQQEGYLAVLPSGDLLASAPARGELWRLDPAGERPPVMVAEGLAGVTGIAAVAEARVLAALTWQHRVERVALP